MHTTHCVFLFCSLFLSLFSFVQFWHIAFHSKWKKNEGAKWQFSTVQRVESFFFSFSPLCFLHCQDSQWHEEMYIQKNLSWLEEEEKKVKRIKRKRRCFGRGRWAINVIMIRLIRHRRTRHSFVCSLEWQDNSALTHRNKSNDGTRFNHFHHHQQQEQHQHQHLLPHHFIPFPFFILSMSMSMRMSISMSMSMSMGVYESLLIWGKCHGHSRMVKLSFFFLLPFLTPLSSYFSFYRDLALQLT